MATFRSFGEEFSHLDSALGNSQVDSEVVSEEDPLMMGEFSQIAQGNHFDQFESSQEIVGVLRDLVPDVHSH